MLIYANNESVQSSIIYAHVRGYAYQAELSQFVLPK